MDSPETPDNSETDAVGDPVIEESEIIEPDRELSSEIVTLAMVGLGSVKDAMESVKSSEETSDLGRAGIATAIGVASSSLEEIDTSVLASLIGTYSSNAASEGALEVIDGSSSWTSVGARGAEIRMTWVGSEGAETRTT